MPTATTAVVSSDAANSDATVGRTRLAFSGIFATGAFAALAFAAPSHVEPSTLAFGLLLGVAIAAMSRRTMALGGMVVSGELVPLLVATTVVPHIAPLLALAVVIARDPSLQLKAINTSAIVLSTCAAVAAVQLVGASGSIAITAVATSAFLFVNSFTIGTYLLAIREVTIRSFVAAAGASVVATTVLLLPVVALVTFVAHDSGVVTAPFVLVPLLLAQYFLSLYHSKVQLTEQLAEKAQILARTNLQFAAAMVRALDTRDAYTAGHSAAVAVYTRDIAREMGFDDETVRLAHLAGLLHDIGKIGVPGRVLNKQSPLDDEEYELMKSHAAMGAEILSEVDLYKDIALLVRYHHERIDGRGYPDQLEGEAIPAISRMISVADTYSAMTTDRPYRDGMPTEKAMSILRECRGTQLDSDFTDAFLRILIVADEAYQRGKQTDFEVEVAKHQALSEVEAEAVRIHAPSPVGPPVPAAPEVPTLPAAVDGELIQVELEREAA